MSMNVSILWACNLHRAFYNFHTFHHKKKVGWLRASDQTVLALEERVVTHNARISVVHEDMRTWRLRIKQLRESDRGCYMCQINASPMKKQIGCIDVQGELYKKMRFNSCSRKLFNLSFEMSGEITIKKMEKSKFPVRL